MAEAGGVQRGTISACECELRLEELTSGKFD